MKAFAKKILWLTLLLLVSVLPVGSQSQSVTVSFGIQISPGHTATLSWQAPASGTVLSYNIYRSLTSGSGFTTIGSVVAPTLNYIDQGLVHGTTYYYVVTAVYSGGESGFSNQVSGTP